MSQPSQTVHSIAEQFAYVQPPQMEPMRTDFSNLFQSNSSEERAAGASAIEIAAARVKDLLRSKKLTDKMQNTNNGNSVTSNGNESSRDGKSIDIRK